MQRNITFSLIAAGSLILAAQGLAQSQEATIQPATVIEVPPPAVPEVRQAVDLAICLDTSGSMSGLIESAKQKLWAIVNDLALAEPVPDLRVALLTYGNDGHNPENGWVRIDSGLTADLDLISQQLFALSTNGGTEYVGRVIQAATGQLEWTPSDDALKLIVVAGNESADQDHEAPFREMCREAISRGIMINSIYCGPATDFIAPGWAEVAKLADGHFASIDHNNGTVVMSTPFDDELASLSAGLNGTYIPFGIEGERGQTNQMAQDANAESMNSSAVAARAATKAGQLYDNSLWDLVDASRDEEFKLEDLSEDALPEEMREMTLEERKKHVEEMSAKRQTIQQQIAEVSKNRQEFIDEEMKKQNLDDSSSFDAALRKAIRGQATSKGFEFPAQEAQSSGTAESGKEAEKSDANP
ncbi:MAG: VWA domain-containing protein [Phycisphaerales bacterium]|nr:MAG: VWA domain-containing protein [Phycisphaerales bacterium]